LNRKLVTIGYLGITTESFFDHLQAHKIECVIDTREIPISRKKGFSKSSLQSQLCNLGITYRHFRLLGSPRRHRHQLRETGDYDRFFIDVDQHYKTTEATEAVKEAISVARELRSCLMCCCPDWRYCHRKALVESIGCFYQFDIIHI
jgi:uncharacterized protein (DUF488 family)